MKIWVFGDSFSKKFEDKYGWDKKYTQLKGYFPKTFSEIMAEELGVELKNYAAYGYCNYDIFHSFVEVVEQIPEEDVIIFQFGSTRILRLADKENKFRTIDLNWNREYSFFNEQQECIDSILANRESDIYKEEIDDWIKMIKLVKPKNNIIFWTPIKESLGNPALLPHRHFTTIADETNYELRDAHLSETGHKEIAEYFAAILNEKKKIF